MVDKSFYNTILSQTFSPSGKYLFTGDIYGEIHGFNLDQILNPSDEKNPQNFKPKIRFESKSSQVCSLATTEQFLVSGGLDEICGWDWSVLLSKSKNPKPAWTIQIPSKLDSLDKTDVNVIVYDKSTDLLYAGCGDNNIYVFSLEDGKLVRSMTEHTDYIHCLHLYGNQLVSSSEDGLVKLWDLRSKNSSNQIAPYQNDKLARPLLGKWVGAAALNEDWLVCGGGPRLSLWHLRSLDVTTVFPISDNGIHVVQFNDDRIMTGGATSHFYQFSYNGEMCAEIPTSSTTTYSAVYQESPKVLSIAGSSAKIDICTNFSYRDQIISLY